MNLAWLIWPFIVVFALVVQSLWRVLHRWYLPVGAGLVTYPIMFVIIVIKYAKPEPLTHETELWQFRRIVRWWHWWRHFGVARLLSDDWTRQPIPLGGYPTDRQVREGVLHVCAAATLTVGSLVLLLLFTYALVTSFTRTVQPFAEGAHR